MNWLSPRLGLNLIFLSLPFHAKYRIQDIFQVLSMYSRTLRSSQDFLYLLRSLYLTHRDTRLGEISPKCWKVSNLIQIQSVAFSISQDRHLLGSSSW